MQQLAPPLLPRWILNQLPAGVDRYRISVGEHTMSVMEVGDGRPVLMLHGNPTWGFLYRKVATALTGEPLRIIMPDLIGLGFSDRPHSDSAHRLENHGRWIRNLVAELDLHDLIFVGQDWGGPIGLYALADEVERVSGMVLMNTVVGPPKEGFKATAFHRFARLPMVSDLAFRGLGFPQSTLFLAQGDKRSIRGRVAKAYRYPLRKRSANQAPLALARMVPDSQSHFSIEPLRKCQGFFESFSGPVEFVWGCRDPILGGVLSFMSKLKPDAPVTETMAGHFLQEEVPDEIADAVRRVAGTC